MAPLRFVLGLLAAAFAHFAATRLLPSFPLAVDLFLVATVLVGRGGRPIPAMFAGLVAGWASDALTGAPFGLHGLANTAVGYGTARAAQQLVVQRPTSLLAVFAAAAAAQSAILVLLELAFVPGAELASPLGLAAKVVSTALIGLACTAAGAAVSRRWFARRRRPQGTLDPRR
jgi:rod shape-determining protein MreD